MGGRCCRAAGCAYCSGGSGCSGAWAVKLAGAGWYCCCGIASLCGDCICSRRQSRSDRLRAAAGGDRDCAAGRPGCRLVQDLRAYRATTAVNHGHLALRTVAQRRCSPSAASRTRPRAPSPPSVAAAAAARQRHHASCRSWCRQQPRRRRRHRRQSPSVRTAPLPWTGPRCLGWPGARPVAVTPAAAAVAPPAEMCRRTLFK